MLLNYSRQAIDMDVYAKVLDERRMGDTSPENSDYTSIRDEPDRKGVTVNTLEVAL